jgi:GT2 family glycosyltransferase
VIHCSAASRLHARDRRLARLWELGAIPRLLLGRWHKAYRDDQYHCNFYLHTNASGDFILAAREAFDNIQGMCETTAFYLHLDCYAIVQLFAAGYEQAIFAQPHRVFHADHDRSGRADFKETILWREHEAVLSAILRGERPYRLNGGGWGLDDQHMPEWRLAA